MRNGIGRSRWCCRRRSFAALAGVRAKQCIFNTVLPILPDAYAAAGVRPDPDRRHRPTADSFIRQGADAEGLIADLDTPERRRVYVAFTECIGPFVVPGAGHFPPVGTRGRADRALTHFFADLR